MLRLLAFLLMIGVTGWRMPVAGQDMPTIFIYDAWLLTEDGRSGTAYATIANASDGELTLQSAHSANAEVMLTPMDAEPLTLASGEEAVLTPDTLGLYVTAADGASLEQGIVLALTFEDVEGIMTDVRFAALPVETPPEASAVVVLAGWARPTTLDAHDNGDPAAVISGAYLTLENRGDSAETLVGVTSPVVGAIEIHESQMDGGIMRMRPLEALTLARGERHALAPGGDHLMLIGLEHHLLPNAALPLTLHFDSGLELSVAVPVRDEREIEADATEAAEHGHHG